MIWREFWQIIWQNRDIDKDLRHDQLDVRHVGCPDVVCSYNTNIKVLTIPSVSSSHCS